MVVLNFLSAIIVNEPTDIWGVILTKVFGFVGNYGWRIVVFTICLKLVLSPIDIYQRVKMRKNQKITERIKPEVEKLQMQYGSNKQVLQQKQMELNKKEGFSYMAACLPSIVTIVIFFWLLSGLQSMSQYMTFKQYAEFYNIYNVRNEQILDEKKIEWVLELNEDGVEDGKLDLKDLSVLDDFNPSVTYESENAKKTAYINFYKNYAIDEAQTAVYDSYHESQNISFGWIKNIWSPDVFWENPIMSKEKFIKNIGKYGTDWSKSSLDKSELGAVTSDYDTVMAKLLASDDNKRNGWLILPVLCVSLSFLSQFVTTRQQRKSGQAATEGSAMAKNMKMMMLIMPFVMGYFSLTYTAVFTLYIITNSAMTLALNLITTYTLIFIDKKRDQRVLIVKDSKSDGYSEKSNSRTKKGDKVSNKDVVLRYGRPDPNDKKNDEK